MALTNEQMKPRRFLVWAQARAKIAFITKHLEAGHTVYLCTAFRATKYSKKHIDMFKATKSGPYVARGKGWDCISFTHVEVRA
jgi:hypothetical protein